jgi:hypothetical protein
MTSQSLHKHLNLLNLLTASAKLTWFLTRENLRNPEPLQANIGSPKQMFLVKKGNEVLLFLKIKLFSLLLVVQR